MTKEFVKEIVSNRLKDVLINEDDNLLIGNHVLRNYSLGTYLIDFGDYKIPRDIKEYQEEHISKYYFNQPGYIQWNYYLIFLREQYDWELKKLIEKDGVYTRKFVFNPEQLTSYFDYQESDKKLDVDVISTWKEKLRNVDLDEVYSEQPYSQAIPRFLDLKVIKDQVEENQDKALKNKLIVNNISKLKLNNTYREYPLTKEFNFGKVNLIKGVNGTGKTSLLESIELILTGKSTRDPNYTETPNCIEAEYNNKDKDTYSPGENSKYRLRDLDWFSNTYKSGNELYRSFNKYNYYDSDAAYNLAYNSDVGQLTKYLSSIALGPEFNRIQDRLSGFHERLLKEQRNRKNILKDEKERISKSKEVLKTIKEISNPEESYKSFKMFSEKIHWKKQIPDKYEDNFLELSSDFQSAKALSINIIESTNKLKLSNVKSIKENSSSLEKEFVQIRKGREELKKIELEIKSKKEDLDKSTNKLRTFNEAKRFFNEKDSFDLIGLSDKISKLRGLIKTDSRALKLYEEIEGADIFKIDITFNQYKIEITNKLIDLKEKSKNASKQVSQLKESLNELDKIVTGIKTYGQSYLKLNQNATNCPLCDSKYSTIELSKRIKNVAADISNNEAIIKLENQANNFETELKMIEEINRRLETLESGISIIHEDKYKELTFVQINQIFIDKTKLLNLNLEQLKAYEKTRNKLNDQGVFEEDLIKCKEQFESYTKDVDFKFSEKIKFEKLLSNAEKELKNLSDRINQLNLSEKEMLGNLTKVFLKTFPESSISKFESDYNYLLKQYDQVLLLFNELLGYIDYNETDDIESINLNIDKLLRFFESFKESIKNNKEVELAKAIIKKSDQSIKNIEPILKRISAGLSIINEIRNDYSETNILADFISKNETEIQDIFRNIHSPKEFSKIKFDEKSNSVLLTREADGLDMPINKISTGQRSALALSIFLALNKKLNNGPNLILFDDPVTFTDDLNILSFLDYLREMVIREDRQMVFATANQKIANLFEKKFEFLEDELQVYPLSR